jgi:thymidylate synthase (FAD)
MNIPLPDLRRRQDKKNRQNSISDLPPGIKLQCIGTDKIAKHFDDAMWLYNNLLDSGVAKESARFVLPLATPTRIYMTGTCRSWIHYIALRSSNGTQEEHRLIAEDCRDCRGCSCSVTMNLQSGTYLKQVFPEVAFNEYCSP